MYVYIKPASENEAWFWGVLVNESDPAQSVWTYERLDQIEIIEHIENELREQEIIALREQEIIALPDLDELLPGNLLADGT